MCRMDDGMRDADDLVRIGDDDDVAATTTTTTTPNGLNADPNDATVEPDVTVATLDWNAASVVDVTADKDGGVLKIVEKRGVGDENPVERDIVTVSYVGYFEDGRPVDPNHVENNTYPFIVGKGTVIKAWDVGVTTMRLGERATFFCRPAYAFGTHGCPPAIPTSVDLIYRIELLHWKGEDITKLKDGGIRKSILEKGSGHETPNEGSTCVVHVAGKYAGRSFEDRDVDFVLGEGSEAGIAPGVEYALKRFKKGERSRLQVTSRYAYDAEGHTGHGIPPHACLTYEVKLKDFKQAKGHWEMTNCERLREAEVTKERGSQFFKAEKYALAKRKYKRVVQYVDVQMAPDDPDDERRRRLLLAGHLNLALCHLKLGDDLSALHSSELALDLDRTNEKGLYRRGVANLGLGNFEEAIHDLTVLTNRDPRNKAAENQLSIANGKLQNLNDKRKSTFAGMFQKFADKDSQREQQQHHSDVFSDIGEWQNELAKDMMTLEQEMAAFGECMPAPRYNNSSSRQEGKENENPGSDED